MGREQDVGRVLVPQMQKRTGEALHRVVDPSHVGMPRARDARGQGGRRPACRALLEIAPQIWLDVDDHLPAEGRRLLHQEREVGVIGVHRAGVVQVVPVPIAFVSAIRG